MLNMLCRSLYDTSLVVLRENLQNAYDAVLMRKHVDSNYANPEIRLYVKDGHLIVQDNGIGMTEKEVDENFWTAGRSGKIMQMLRLPVSLAHLVSEPLQTLEYALD